MIAYRASDVKLSWKDHTNSGEMGVPKICGYVKEGLELEGSGNDEDDDDAEHVHSVNNNNENVANDNNNKNEHSRTIWMKSQNQIGDNDEVHHDVVEQAADKTKSRKKRQADQYEYTPTKTRCPLLLVADYRFFQEMGGGNTKTTINYLVYIRYLL